MSLDISGTPISGGCADTQLFGAPKCAFVQSCPGIHAHTHTYPTSHLPQKSAGFAHFEDPIRLSVYLTTFQPPEAVYFYNVLQLRNY